MKTGNAILAVLIVVVIGLYFWASVAHTDWQAAPFDTSSQPASKGSR